MFVRAVYCCHLWSSGWDDIVVLHKLMDSFSKSQIVIWQFDELSLQKLDPHYEQTLLTPLIMLWPYCFKGQRKRPVSEKTNPGRIFKYFFLNSFTFMTIPVSYQVTSMALRPYKLRWEGWNVVYARPEVHIFYHLQWDKFSASIFSKMAPTIFFKLIYV